MTKPPRRHARRARGAAREGSILEQYVDRLSGEPARRQACRSGVSAVAVEAFVNNAGYGSGCSWRNISPAMIPHSVRNWWDFNRPLMVRVFEYGGPGLP